MNIERKRWIVVRKRDGAIFCGLARNYKFKLPGEIGNTAIKTYLSESKAFSAAVSSWLCDGDDIEVIPVIESIKSVEED